MPPSASTQCGSKDNFIHVQSIKASFEEAKKKGTFFVILKVDDGRIFKSRKYRGREEIDWAIEQKFSSTSKLSLCLVKRRLFLSDKKIGFPDFNIRELDGNTTHACYSVGSSRIRVIVERKDSGPFIDIIRRLLEESQQRLSTMKVFLERLGKACDVLNRISRFVEPMTEINPAVSAAVSAVTVLYEMCKRQREVHAAATSLISDIASFLPFTDLHTDRLRSTIVERTAYDILVLFEKVARSIIKYSSETVLGDLLVDRMGEIDSYKEQFGKLKETFEWCLRVEIWKTALKIGLSISFCLSFSQFLMHFTTRGKRVSRTRGRSFSAKSKEWCYQTSSLFWLYGEEGTGKTTIAHTVARVLDEEDRLAACFFWDKNDRDRRQAERLIPTLAYQLAKWHADYRAEILDILEGHDERAIHTGLESQFELLFRNPLNKLYQGKSSDSRPPRERQLIIVLDGLDESCDSIPARRTLAGFVRDISTLVPWLKVFVCSRRPPELEDCFEFNDANQLGLNYPPYDLRGEIRCRFADRSARFMDAYRHGLTGPQAQWVNKRYHGHRVLNARILAEMSAAGI